MDQKIITELRSAIGAYRVACAGGFGRVRLRRHVAGDAARCRRASANDEHVAAVLRIANQHVSRAGRTTGSATGLAGATVHARLDLPRHGRMNRILDISTADTLAVAQAQRDHLRSAAGGREARPLLSARSGERLSMHGRRERGDQRRRPALSEIRRHRRLRFGGLDVVLAGGHVLHLGRQTRSKMWPGTIFKRLFIGSEGTFGVVTEITVRLMPSRRHNSPLWRPSRSWPMPARLWATSCRPGSSRSSRS